MSDSVAIDPRKLVAEILGTFTLVFVGAGAAVASGADIVAVALAHGLAFALMISALGHLAGGLFNPALTIGLWVTRRLDTVDAVGFIIAQLVGAVLGALALVVLFPDNLRDNVALGTPVLTGVTFAQGVGIELLLTAFLMIAVFGSMLDKRAAGIASSRIVGSGLGSLGLGLVLTMDIAAGGRFTGAAVNPARAFGPALMDSTWDDHLVYWIGPIVGAVAAALLYHYVFTDDAEAVAV